MKKFLPAIFLFCLTWPLATSQSVTLPPSGDNQKCIVTQYIGAMVKGTVTYNKSKCDRTRRKRPDR